MSIRERLIAQSEKLVATYFTIAILQVAVFFNEFRGPVFQWVWVATAVVVFVISIALGLYEIRDLRRCRRIAS